MRCPLGGHKRAELGTSPGKGSATNEEKRSEAEEHNQYRNTNVACSTAENATAQITFTNTNLGTWNALSMPGATFSMPPI